MGDALPVSVVIVSRGRPEALVRCLIGVGQLLYPQFEVVVVADPAGLAALRAAGWEGRAKLVAFDEANISAARNLGIAQAAGEVVAFLDDDAVPEPTWLSHLVAPFADARVTASGGFVLGRNGISYQWKARTIAPDGSARPLDVPEDRISILAPWPEAAIKTEGTNMAVRRSALAELGGFDHVYRFYLDESDLNLRLARAGHATAIVPMAQVHHGFAASVRRRADRVPTDLTEIAASLAVFQRRHRPAADPGPTLAAERAAQRRRLLSLMIAGRIEPRDLRLLLAGFDRGRAEGMARPLLRLAPLPGPAEEFRPFRRRVPALGHLVIAGPRRDGRALRARAAQAVAAGHTVSLYLFSMTARHHRVRFEADGFWLQEGGLFGRSDRSDPPFRRWRLEERVTREVDRTAALRGSVSRRGGRGQRGRLPQE